MRSKLEAGNFKAALRILCSDDASAPPNDAILQALKDKHPGPAVDRRTPIDPTGNLRYTPLQISPDDIRKSLPTFPIGSSGGPNGLTPQHLIDLLAGDSDNRLLNALTDLINLMRAEKFDSDINTIIYGGWFIALLKKTAKCEPIAVGYVLRRLAAKCANSHVIEDCSKILQPRQVGVGIAGVFEAAIHSARRYISQLPSAHSFIKLDFANAFNTLRRNLLLDTVAINTPELYRFTLATYECVPTLVYGSHTIPSREGPQQGYPLSSLAFCESIQPIPMNSTLIWKLVLSTICPRK